MKFFTVLLFASLAATSLAVQPGSEDEIHMNIQHLDANTQSTPTSHTSKESTSSKDSSKEPSIFREELVSKDNVVIEFTKPISQKAEDGLKNMISQMEETAGPTTSAVTTSEGKLPMLIRTVEEKLSKTIEEFINGVEDIIPGANGIVSHEDKSA